MPNSKLITPIEVTKFCLGVMKKTSGLPSLHSNESRSLELVSIEKNRMIVLEDNIEFYGRAILHHGLLDEEVPWQTSLKIAEKLCSDNVKIQLDKTANHRYSEPEQINSLINSLEELTS